MLDFVGDFDVSSTPVVVEESPEEKAVKAASVKELVGKVDNLVRERDELLSKAASLQKELRDICHGDLVEQMQALGQQEFKLDTGHKVSIKCTPTARIVEGQEERAYEIMRSAGANESIRHSLFFEVTDNGKDFLRIAKRVLEALECEGVQVKTAVSAKELTLFMEAAIVDDVYLPEDVFAYTSVPYAEIRLGRSIVTKKPKFE